MFPTFLLAVIRRLVICVLEYSFRRRYVPVEVFHVVSDVSDLLLQKSAVVVLSQYLSLRLPNILTGM